MLVQMHTLTFTELAYVAFIWTWQTFGSKATLLFAAIYTVYGSSMLIIHRIVANKWLQYKYVIRL